MASADKKVEVTEVILYLSYAEAEALAEVLSCVGGDPKGQRGKLDAIAYALETIDILPSCDYGGTPWVEGEVRCLR